MPAFDAVVPHSRRRRRRLTGCYYWSDSGVLHHSHAHRSSGRRNRRTAATFHGRQHDSDGQVSDIRVSNLISGRLQEHPDLWCRERGRSKTWFIPTSDLPAGTWYWRVRATDHSQPNGPKTGDFTAPLVFVVSQGAAYINPPSPLSPSFGATVDVGTAVQYWDGLKGAPGGTANDPFFERTSGLKYQVDVGTDPGLLSPAASVFADGTTFSNESAAAVLPELAFATTYYWRVRAIDNVSGIQSAYSPAWRFSTYGPTSSQALLHIYVPACGGWRGASLYGSFTIDGQSVVFVSQYSANGSKLSMQLLANGAAWAGSVSGYSASSDFKGVTVAGLNGAGSAFATATQRFDGEFDGVLNGSIRVADSRYGDSPASCSGEMNWVLMPPR